MYVIVFDRQKTSGEGQMKKLLISAAAASSIWLSGCAALDLAACCFSCVTGISVDATPPGVNEIVDELQPRAPTIAKAATMAY
jgi:hypothetical protein